MKNKIMRNIFLRTWLKNAKISEIQHLYLLFNVKIEMVHMSKKKKLFRLCLSWISLFFVCNLKHWEVFLFNRWFFKKLIAQLINWLKSLVYIKFIINKFYSKRIGRIYETFLWYVSLSLISHSASDISIDILWRIAQAWICVHYYTLTLIPRTLFLWLYL